MRLILAAALSVFSFFATAAFAQESNFPTSQELEDQANGVVARHEGWQIRCDADGTNCLMFQIAQDGDGNNVVSVTMQALPEGSSAKVGVVMVSPLLTLLPRGLSLNVDDAAPSAYPYSWCDPQGCYSRFGLTEAQVDDFKAGTNANIDIFAITQPDSAVRAVLPLAGFTDALADLESR